MNVGIDFLEVEEDAGEGGGKGEGCVGCIVGGLDEVVGKGVGGEGGREEGFVVDVGRLFVGLCWLGGLRRTGVGGGGRHGWC